MDLTDFAPIAQLGATGVLLSVVWWLLRAIAKGDWVSRRELDYLRADRDARLAEKEREIAEWRAAFETERHGREIAVEQSGQLLSVSGTLTRTLDALRARGEGGPQHVG